MKMPSGLGPDGRRVWKAVTEKHEFEAPTEPELLERACRVRDVIAALEKRLGGEVVTRDGRVRPELVELRLQVQQYGRLMLALRVPVKDESGDWRKPQRRGPRGLYAVGEVDQ